MATAQNINLTISLAKGFFQRNNPIEAVVMGTIQTVYNLVTLRSRIRILKYRYMLETQKLERIETTLAQFNPYQFTGRKIERTF